MNEKYKTYNELKEELGNKFEEYMYKANIELLEKIDIGGFCELKKKCDEGLCDCTNEEYNNMAECNMKLSLENDELQQENKHLNLQLNQALKDYDELLEKIDKAIEYNKEVLTWTTNEPITDEIAYKNLEILERNNNECGK